MSLQDRPLVGALQFEKRAQAIFAFLRQFHPGTSKWSVLIKLQN
jgi:hypothetical protein